MTEAYSIVNRTKSFFAEIGAELGFMRVTEQIDAMEVSGTNPFKYLVVTRVVATTLMLPLLIIMGDASAFRIGPY